MKIDCDAKYFNPQDVLECGQTFRFRPYKDGYFVNSRDKACYVKTDGVKTVVECGDGDGEYFYNYFDMERDYSQIVARAEGYGVPLLSRSAEACAGLRLLNQDSEEMIYSFIISQNNNIPRIKGIISRICEGLGEKKSFLGEEYFSFPRTESIAAAGKDFFKSCGCGYRDSYLAETSLKILQNAALLSALKEMPTEKLRRELLSYKGIGGKVADCILLFGFSRRDCFPVDTWVEKVYREDFGGELKDRNAITRYFCEKFGEDSGYVQQYLFYGKRKNL